MNRKYRKTVIAGNWKMNMLPSEVKPYADTLRALAGKTKHCEVVICAPFVMLPQLIKALRDCRIAVGAQNVSDKDSGAYTGEVSANQLRDLGVKYVIIGHSERRSYFGETDEMVRAKVTAAIGAGLIPIICVGETLEQREMGVTKDLISMQVKLALSAVPPEKMRRVIFAYEPVWAIGTGKTASAEEAGEVCSHIRAIIRSLYGARIARAVTIQYGGSMNKDNAAQLLSMPDIDGGLIGGASLDPEHFAAIIEAANQ
ncbi:MAG TPA: triose-phosphate isomerase [Clostridiales bacterium]|jgi:triosephosphate isomerase|nr:triose-phosphate isomerase [Clostridiales bacterium]